MSQGQPTIKGLQRLQSVAANALDDDDYRERLVKDPAGVLKQEGITVPDDVNVVVHQNTAKKVHLVLPTEQHSEDQLDANETDITRICTTVHF